MHGSQDDANVWYLLTQPEKKKLRILDRKYKKAFGEEPVQNGNLLYDLDQGKYHSDSGLLNICQNGPSKLLRRDCMAFINPVDMLAMMGWPCDFESAVQMGTTVLPHLEHARSDSFVREARDFRETSILLLLALVCFGPKGHK